MRTSIVLWSAVAGAVIGVVVDALLLGVILVAGALVPALGNRLSHRWIAVTGVILLAAIPIALGLIGAVEGRLKAN